MARPRILVVDDEPDVVGVIEAALTLAGVDVLTAYDGMRAVDLASAEKPDLVLLDLMMPIMGGYEVCELLKTDPQTRDIPIVCLTSAQSHDILARVLQAGAQGLILKPFAPADLARDLLQRLEPSA